MLFNERGAVRFERSVFHSIFPTHDQKERMAAFIDKRKADFKYNLANYYKNMYVLAAFRANW